MGKILIVLLTFSSFSLYSQDDTTDFLIKPNWETPVDQFDIQDTIVNVNQADSSIAVSAFRLSDIVPEQIIPKWIQPEAEKPKEPELSESEIKMLESDVKFMQDLPKSYDQLPKEDLKNILVQIDGKIIELRKELESLLKERDSNKELIKTKQSTLIVLEKEKNIIGLTLSSDVLKDENGNLITENDGLKNEKDKLKKYLYISSGIVALLVLITAVVIQRKRISVQDAEIQNQIEEINKKNSYLEHAATIIRHDMHSGINTYIPRGITSLEKRLTDDDIQRLKIDGALKMVKEGLNHTQRVYKSVYEFTNLVKQNVVLNKSSFDIKELILKYIASNPYRSQVEISDLGKLEVNEVLFCNAIENLIKNGLTYNDSQEKKVKIYLDGDYIMVEDNGRGFTQSQFEKQLKRYSNKNESLIEEKGLGLNICLAIIEEHGYKLSCERINTGTKMKIKIS
jgi:signal transduction histidine kinase